VFALFITAIGVVFGDIGTSPLYTIKETFGGHHPLPIDRLHVMGVLSLIFWALTLIVAIKYVIVIMRADNNGEGGSLALLALLSRAAEPKSRRALIVGSLGLAAAALFYGDSVITPAISVLSAVEGLQVAAPEFGYVVIPLTIAILVLLFALQRSGTALVGALFGPVMILWFVVLAVLGVQHIVKDPTILWALSPHYAVMFFMKEGGNGMLALGAVVLAVTGAEALYADMGHFGRVPIRVAWYLLVWPALLLNYFGQGAMLLAAPDTLDNPLIRMAPQWLALPLVFLGMAAAIIASQAVISGAFSITQQAIQLGYLPRMHIQHTSDREMGQIYIPFVNWTLMVSVVVLVLLFGSSSNLAAAYGIAVTGTMLITAILAGMVMGRLWGWRRGWVRLLTGIFLLVDGAFFLANAVKIPYGGWLPLVMGAAIFIVLTTWKRGRNRLRDAMEHDSIPIELVLDSAENLPRARGTAVYLSGNSLGTPVALLHNLKHNQILHERVVLLTVIVENVPFVRRDARIESKLIRNNVHRVVLHYGFMQTPDIPTALANAKESDLGFFYEPMRLSYFVTRMIARPSGRSGMPHWREAIFAWMVTNAATSTDFFNLPMNRVVELGANIEI
jgi:KUP system potassium uptake protein